MNDLRTIVKDSMREAFYSPSPNEELPATASLQENLLMLEEFDREIEVWISGKH